MLRLEAVIRSSLTHDSERSVRLLDTIAGVVGALATSAGQVPLVVAGERHRSDAEWNEGESECEESGSEHGVAEGMGRRGGKGTGRGGRQSVLEDSVRMTHPPLWRRV